MKEGRRNIQTHIVSIRDLLSLRSSPRRDKPQRKVLTLAIAHLLQRGLVTEVVLARLHDERETRGNALGALRGLALLGGGHCSGKDLRA